jgi:hypothetical protein
MFHQYYINTNGYWQEGSIMEIYEMRRVQFHWQANRIAQPLTQYVHKDLAFTMSRLHLD